MVKTEDGNRNLKAIFEKTNDHLTVTGRLQKTLHLMLTEGIINSMKKSKAAGLDGLTTEHLRHCHPSLPTFLAKLFNIIMETGIVPDKFGLSYTIPLLKGNNVSVC